MLETFKAMKGGKFAPLIIKNNEDADMNSVITTFNTAVTETASETLGKHRQKKKGGGGTGSLQIFFFFFFENLCDKRRELIKKRFEPEGPEKFKEVNNNIKRCIKKRQKKAG